MRPTLAWQELAGLPPPAPDAPEDAAPAPQASALRWARVRRVLLGFALFAILP